MTAAIGDTIPDIELTATGEKTLKLSDFRGQRLVLYFYPKASTPGCTLEGLDFTAAADDFAKLNTAILGASRDGIKAQENFKTKQGFVFDLLSDKDEQLCKAFDVIKPEEDVWQGIPRH
jgi:peroxiredoxin Q/BCP